MWLHFRPGRRTKEGGHRKFSGWLYVAPARSREAFIFHVPPPRACQIAALSAAFYRRTSIGRIRFLALRRWRTRRAQRARRSEVIVDGAIEYSYRDLCEKIWNAVGKKKGSGIVEPAHWIIRRQFRAAVSCVVRVIILVHRVITVSRVGRVLNRNRIECITSRIRGKHSIVKKPQAHGRRCRNSDIRERCDLKDVAIRVEKDMSQWFHRPDMMNENRQTEQIYRANVCDEKVGKGRPRKSYANDIGGMLKKDQILRTRNRRACTKRLTDHKRAVNQQASHQKVEDQRHLWVLAPQRCHRCVSSFLVGIEYLMEEILASAHVSARLGIKCISSSHIPTDYDPNQDPDRYPVIEVVAAQKRDFEEIFNGMVMIDIVRNHAVRRAAAAPKEILSAWSRNTSSRKPVRVGGYRGLVCRAFKSKAIAAALLNVLDIRSAIVTDDAHFVSSRAIVQVWKGHGRACGAAFRKRTRPRDADALNADRTSLTGAARVPAEVVELAARAHLGDEGAPGLAWVSARASSARRRSRTTNTDGVERLPRPPETAADRRPPPAARPRSRPGNNNPEGNGPISPPDKRAGDDAGRIVSGRHLGGAFDAFQPPPLGSATAAFLRSDRLTQLKEDERK
ncbi:hypothetical protein EVAR_59492_1 [Eumeta japonica]|uniref:Uncharacterized protein n=1 Tax=Eumeta variegata TaxID=151549 RepID=A0A4C1YJH2_EUMVA|nr:hypothetical protein EVAR_59492_1 [Eumeta japonica]